MSRMILVPIDISDKEFTERIISHVESEARIDDAEVHFLTVIPSLPYYASLGIASHRPDITTYLLGSNAAAVVRHAECSVLVVR